jgi:O-acetylhomoserine/O-acetylserine sulfhydrylase-like pyridoxal-dependent enzyme
MTDPAWGFETRQIHTGWDLDPNTGARAVPIYQTTRVIVDGGNFDFGYAERIPNFKYARSLVPPPRLLADDGAGLVHRRAGFRAAKSAG